MGVRLAEDILNGLVDCKHIGQQMKLECCLEAWYLLLWMVSASLSGISMLNSCSAGS